MNEKWGSMLYLILPVLLTEERRRVVEDADDVHQVLPAADVEAGLAVEEEFAWVGGLEFGFVWTIWIDYSMKIIEIYLLFHLVVFDLIFVCLFYLVDSYLLVFVFVGNAVYVFPFLCLFSRISEEIPLNVVSF